MIKWTALSLGVLMATTAAEAQTYPSKTITIVVTAAAGGVSDVVARGIGQRLSQAWGQQVVIENKGGGAHIIGAQAVAKAPPDGYTLLVAEARRGDEAQHPQPHRVGQRGERLGQLDGIGLTERRGRDRRAAPDDRRRLELRG